MLYVGFKFLLFMVMILLAVSFLTLVERKLLGIIGFRQGPLKVSLFGILQPMADAMKLFSKQNNFLINFSFFWYYFSAFFMIFMSLFLWNFIFIEPKLSSFKVTVLFFMLVLFFNSINSIFSGWSTFGKFSILGSLRTVIQLISYEGVLYLVFFFFLVVYSSLSLYFFSFLGMFFAFFFPICMKFWVFSFLAELNRTPYDFSEGESELVSGFNVDHGSNMFVFIFLSEYSNIIFMSSLSSFLFFNNLFILFFFFFFFFVVWIRSVVPRYRFDKLMSLAWKFVLPILTFYFSLFMSFLL